MLKNYTKEELQLAINNSKSVKEVLEYFDIGSIKSSYHYREFKRLVQLHSLDVSHLNGYNGSSFGTTKRDIQCYLNNDFPITSSKLKARLLKEEIMMPICSECKLTTWNNKPIPLELDHINGDSFNNNLTNLRLLCPNCHAQTETYCGKNMKPKTPKVEVCPTCENEYTGRKQYCSLTCIPLDKRTGPKKCDLTNDEVLKVLRENGNNYSKTGKLLGISDNAVRKRVKNLL